MSKCMITVLFLYLWLNLRAASSTKLKHLLRAKKILHFTFLFTAALLPTSCCSVQLHQRGNVVGVLTKPLRKHTLLAELIWFRWGDLCAEPRRLGRLFFFFLKARIVNYFGTDGSQSAIEFDYRLNGIHNERALIWRKSYEKAISITPHAKLGYQPRRFRHSDDFLFLIFFLSFFPFNDSQSESWWTQLFIRSLLKSARAAFLKARCFCHC